MTRILITGSSGFIGRHLVDRALKKGYEVWAGTRKINDKTLWRDKRINLINLQYNDKKALKQQIIEHTEIYGKWDYIVHNAGVTKCLNPEAFDIVNFEYAANLIDVLEETDSIPEKFLLMSSLSACGPGDEDEYTPISPKDIPNPNTAYGLSKLKAEQYLRLTKTIPHIILRSTGVYGPGDQDYLLMFKTIQAGFDLSVGFRKQLLTFIYVTDLVKAVFFALEKPVVNKTYFVADGDVYTDKQFTQIVKKALGKKHLFRIKIPLFMVYIISVIAEEIAKFKGKPSTLNRDKYQIMKQRNWTCDTAPLFEELNYLPYHSLKTGVAETIKWYKKEGWLK